jgi:hypothetical protein
MTARARSSTVAAPVACTGRTPWARSAWLVMGPIDAARVLGKKRRRSRGVKFFMKASTVEEEVNVTRSTSPKRRDFFASAVRAKGRVS